LAKIEAKINARSALAHPTFVAQFEVAEGLLKLPIINALFTIAASYLIANTAADLARLWLA
jgi:hypothetical protein